MSAGCSNTLVVAGVATLAVVPIASLRPTRCSRVRGRAVSMAALLILVTQMMPPVLLLVPYFIIFRELGLLDGLVGLILANFAWTLPVTAWLMKSAFDSVPSELEEAALVDGCGAAGALISYRRPAGDAGAGWRPRCSPSSPPWDEYFFARTLIANSANWVVSVGLGSFTSDYSTSWQQIMAVATASTLPPVHHVSVRAEGVCREPGGRGSEGLSAQPEDPIGGTAQDGGQFVLAQVQVPILRQFHRHVLR